MDTPEQKLVYEVYEETNKWVCSLCYPGVKEIGEIADGFWLAFFEGNYIIVGYNGHRDDWAFVFEDKPTPNPDPQNQPCPTCGKENAVSKTDLQAGYRCGKCPDERCEADDNDPLLQESLAWLDRIDYFKWLVPVEVGYDFMRSCIETGGWNQEEYKIFDQWLYDKAGRLIKEWENAQNIQSDGSVVRP